MKLIDALAVIRRPLPETAPLLRICLACGFTPLHFETFLKAALCQRSPVERIETTTGLFGDLAGNIEGIRPEGCDVLVVAIEWQDLDLRLGVRNLGGWRVADLPDIVKSAHRMLARLEKAILTEGASVPTYISLPTLPLPPLFTTPSHQASAYELELRQALSSFGASLATKSRIRILSASHLDEVSPPSNRFDIQSELSAGFPYRISHASALAELLAALIRNPSPKKGLITDLDDTLWSGILGENGVDGISWHLDQRAHIHGLYQQFLASLASAGILTAVASKNEPALVQQAFEREDLLIDKQSLYPIDVHWGPKSESVRRILKTWNIAADSVVFIDDSPMELAEVKAAFPDMECLVFPKPDYQTFWQLLRRLRDAFGKTTVSEEDSIRLESIRAAAPLPDSSNGEGTSLDSFLQDAQASVTISFGKEKEDHRAFELINKTNQFNLNGKRVTESSWMAYFNDPAIFLMTVSYDDKYGALGKIAVLLGRMQGKAAAIDCWVMSCRAFSRRIEHQSLSWLFENFDLQEITFAYQPTDRNKPIQDFLASITTTPLSDDVRVSRVDFSEKCPPLFHQAKAAVNA
ncbi:MAG: subfamily HAD-superfamily phosphatase [Candidatus Acidoferrum typicum]|nr:subfamily HAD-superfamily phosphatase [Candidatus Acidoferrum typicum]